MNPSFPNSSGDRHPGPPQSGLPSSAGGLGKSGQPSHPHTFHTQPPLTQLAHPGHHGSTLHPLHGGHSGSILHSGPPPLPGPPLTSSLNSSGARSPHHPLPSSILHPPRGGSLSQGGASSLGKNTSGGMGGGPSGSFPVRMQPQGASGNNPVPGLKPSYSIRPGSPRRMEGGMSQQSNQQSQHQQQPKQQYGMERGGESDANAYYHQQQMNRQQVPVSTQRTRELRVEDALLYLDEVKQQFGNKPDIYNAFLDVMKDFKAQTIDTPGVIVRVSNLFRGYPNLIVGFNTFLPPGYRIRPDCTVDVNPLEMEGGGKSERMQSSYPPPPPGAIPRQAIAPAPPKPQKPKPKAPRNSNSKPVEFDHAIHYVTTIKKRFANEPETYKAFLEILHTYQREARSIREVLDQVSFLFRDHPDLLREFTYFLPDAVQEQAKERLNRAAEKAQMRKDRGAASSGVGSGKGSEGKPYGRRGESPKSGGQRPRQVRGRSEDDDGDYYKERGPDEYENRLISPRDESMDPRREKERERDRNKALFAHKRAKRRSYDGKERRDFLAVSDAVVETEEWGIFERIKKILPSRDNWREFLKCLELYSQEVLGREEMLSLMRNLFGRHTDLVEEFDRLLCSHGQQKTSKEIWPFIPLAETDLSQCRRATPSYRALPSSYPIPPCSYRSKLETSVCNDLWVSVPTGSEDFSFKNMRKNQYEEALFKCEDERFEIDMVIDANASTISILEPLAREIELLKGKDGSEEKLWNYVVEKGTFRVTHLNAITRIYGESGTQILDLLRKYPAGAIPVILKRLKQKDDEWRRAREDLNKQWKEVNEKNYHKSLDHSSFYFKQKDKKQTSLKVLIQEAKKKLEGVKEEQRKKEEAEKKDDVDAKAPPRAQEIADALEKEQAKDKAEDKKPVSEDKDKKDPEEWKPHFKYKFGSVQIHKDAYSLLSYAAEKNLSASDKEKVGKIWNALYLPFFHLQEEWLLRKPKRTNVCLEKAKTLRAGTEVSTEFGEGTIQQFDKEKKVHVVNLPIAQAYLQPDAISIQEATDFPPNLEVSDDLQAVLTGKTGKKSVLYGGQHAYAFVRLYQMLHSRLEQAYELCEKAKRNRYRRTINPAAKALQHSRHTNSDGKEKAGDYQAFLSNVYALIDGSIDSTKYEDNCRSLMGSTSYFLFTMDKLIQLVLKQMQQLGADDTCQELLKMFKEHNDPLAGPVDHATYLNKTKGAFEGEGAFRIEFRHGVLRRTVEPLRGAATTPRTRTDLDQGKIWAPSPRVRQHEPNKWLVEPELCVEYLGSVDDGEEDDDDDGDESPSATPPETPIATPLTRSPVRNSAKTVKKETADSDGDGALKRSRSDSQDTDELDLKKAKKTSDQEEELKDDHDEEMEDADANATNTSADDPMTGEEEGEVDEDDDDTSATGKSTVSAESASGDEMEEDR